MSRSDREKVIDATVEIAAPVESVWKAISEGLGERWRRLLDAIAAQER